MILISIHVDGYYGLTKGVPRLLNVLDKYNLKANFYITMGRESNLFEILWFRGKKESGENKLNIESRYLLREKISMLLLNRKIGSGKKTILRKLEKKGHEVNPHCWSHLKWSKNFERLNLEKEFKKIGNSYFNCLNHKPNSFVPPVWKWDERVIDVLRKEKYHSISIRSTKKEPSLKEGILLLPLSFDYSIEELLGMGYTKENILKTFEEEIEKDYCHIYFHADYEGIKGLKFFEKIASLMAGKKTYTIKEFYEHFIKEIHPKNHKIKTKSRKV